MSKFLKSSLAGLVGAQAATIAFTWDDKCTEGGAIAKVSDMKFIGNELGKEIKVEGTGEFKETAGKGTQYSMIVSAMGIPLLSVKNDFCSDSVVNLPMGMGSVNMKGLSCPTAAGEFSLDESLTLSEHMVFRRASVQLSAANAAGKQYFCISLNGLISENEHHYNAMEAFVEAARNTHLHPAIDTIKNTASSKALTAPDAAPKAASIAFTWDSKCTSSDAMAQVDDMKFDGNTLGEEIKISGTGVFKQAAKPDTTYTIVVYAMGIPLLSQTHGFCSDSVVTLPMGMGKVDMKGLACPTDVGAFTLSESLTLSPHMVFKKASVQLTAQDGNKKQYFCINLNGVISSEKKKTEEVLYI